MKSYFRFLITAAVLTAFASNAHANTPGKHTVLLTWTASPTAGVTYNVYRGTAANVCGGTPTPLASGIAGTSYTDAAPPTGPVFYNVSAVGPSGESACNGEVTVTVPQITTQPPATVTGVVQ